MKQLTQKLKDGRMQIIEVPIPDLGPGMILIRNLYSLISAGTEGGTVKAARKGYIGKAKERPQQVKQVIDTFMSQGPVQTYRAVMKKLEAYSPLGYSCVGEVIDLAPGVDEFQIGDIVACGGAGASHAEVVAVPINLCVRIAHSSSLIDDGKLRMAAYNTLGAIALQGVRQADLRLGETCAVIGMGLLGQLTTVLLKASGVRVIGIDVDPAMVRLGDEHCVDLALLREDSGIDGKISEYTNGIGCDAVIITAASKSLDPINFAGAIARKKATIVVVGDIPTGFNREPYFYKKELTVKMSCSYGPGRYDPEYEEKGRDYPPAYVRWTEKRNMQAFQDLISQGRVDIDYLTTHVFKLEDAPKAYDMIVGRTEPCVGILIEYNSAVSQIKRDMVYVKKADSQKGKGQGVTIGFIGAGSYAQSYLLPNIPRDKDVVLKGVMTASSAGSRSVADRYGFEFCTGREDDILSNDEINTIFIATRHDTHGYYVKKALEAGKHVFVEKPLCLTYEEFEEIRKCCELSATSHQLIMVGYNRRFSPLTQVIKERITSGPMSMIFRVNAGAIPADSWIQDKEIGGGRILGEVCHFVDYLTHIIGALPVSVYAASMRDTQGHDDTLSVSLKYENGSIGSIQYFANGPKSLAKEYVEIYSHGVTAILKDFRELEIHGTGKPFRKKLASQDKGQKNEVVSFVDAIRNGTGPIIAPHEIFNTSEVTFKIIESIRTGAAIKV